MGRTAARSVLPAGLAAMIVAAALITLGAPIRADNAVVVVDNGGLEDGWVQDAWTFYDDINAGTLCDLEWCGVAGFDEGPHSGDFWLNLGAITSEDRLQEVTQSIVIPEGSTTLSFWLQKGSAGDIVGSLEIRLDDATLYREEVPPAIPKQGYEKHSFDISEFADGESHMLMLRAETEAGLGGVDWHIDDVAVMGCELDVVMDPTVKLTAKRIPFDVHLEHHRVDPVTVPVRATLSDTRGWVVGAWESDSVELVYGDSMSHRFQVTIPDDVRLGNYLLEICVDEMSGGRTLCESSEFVFIAAEEE